MKEKITGIVLGTIRHSDRHNVTNIYTRERGRLALLTPVGTTKKGRQTSSRLMPLSVVEAQVNISASRDLHIPAGIIPVKVWRSIYYDPSKSTIALFLSEFLGRLLHDSPAETRIWDFIAGSVELLDESEDKTAIANFHIAFLMGMMHLTGIFPDISNYSDGMEFDMKSGKMTLPYAINASREGFRVDAQRTKLIPKLARINYSNSRHFRFNGKERSEVVEEIIRYFGCHFPGTDRLKSLDVMKEIFG